MEVYEIEQLFGPPYTPTANPFVERIIGTTRREFLKQTYFYDADDLSRKLKEFSYYYNNFRVHEGIDGLTPNQKSGEIIQKTAAPEDLKWKKCCYGLYDIPFAA